MKALKDLDWTDLHASIWRLHREELDAPETCISNQLKTASTSFSSPTVVHSQSAGVGLAAGDSVPSTPQILTL